MKFITALLLCVCLIAACDRAPRSTSAGYDPGLEREAYQARVKARLDEFAYRFDGLEARLKGLDKATQEHLRLDIAELRDRKDALERKFNDLKKVSDESWIDVKESLDQSLDQLELAYNIVAANNHGTDHGPLDRPRPQ